MRKVQRFDMRGNTWPSEDGEIVSYKDYAALQQKLDAAEANHQSCTNELVESVLKIDELQKKLDAVLAENVALKGFIDEECYTLGEEWSSNGQVTDAAQSVPETPATDAALNAVRADAIDSAAEKAGQYAQQLKVGTDGWHKWKLAVMFLVGEAQSLRAETDTTSPQYESLAGGK